MKKLVLLLSVLFLFGCVGLQPKPIVTAGTDIAFVLVLQNNPSYKPEIVKALNDIKTVLSGSITYDDLLVQITKLLPGKYAIIASILIGELNGDQPVSTTVFPMLDSYKTDIVKELDHLILLAG